MLQRSHNSGRTTEIHNVEELLQRIAEAGDGPSISVGDIVQHLGRRSFGPVLLCAVLPTFTPISTIPGLPSTVGLIVVLTSAQMLLGMSHLWLPQALLRRSIARARVAQAVRRMRRIARVVDRLVRPRFAALTEAPFFYAIALCCLLLGLLMFPLEIVPFTSGIPSFPVAVFGLALTARDGIVAMLGFIAAASAVAIVIAILLFGVAILDLVWS